MLSGPPPPLHGNSYKASDNKYSKKTNKGFNNFIRHILPPPPDTRRVLMVHPPHKSHEAQQIEQIQHSPQQALQSTQAQQQERKISISAHNTMLIGDYISAVFPADLQLMLVQAIGNATFQSTADLICADAIQVCHRYIFLQLGGNQIRSMDKEKVFKAALTVVIAIRERSPESRIFMLGVLPKPVENDSAKVHIMKFNRWLSIAVKRIDALFHRVKFLPVQLPFLNASGPIMEYYNSDDQLTLNQAGAEVLRRAIFRLAGFVKNTSG